MDDISPSLNNLGSSSEHRILEVVMVYNGVVHLFRAGYSDYGGYAYCVHSSLDREKSLDKI